VLLVSCHPVRFKAIGYGIPTVGAERFTAAHPVLATPLAGNP
jgi:hypothetical protein